ncbi:MAG: ABC transporter ATP-binding protein [Candidatus Aminicenantes bacterium]|nr:MAG: ABC transporter ATP-binding protein [Candidatus Aminicenantes bacterium]
MNKLLELQSVTAGYNGHIILKDVNLAIYDRDFLGIIGANGSGKTTLIRVLLGLMKPIKGTVDYFFDPPDKAGKRIGYLPQQAMFDRKFPITVQDVVLSGLASKVGVFKSFSKQDKVAADEVLERMGIPELKKRAIGTLSGGQLQRVFLARALVSSPALLVLDEPDTFVDQSFTSAFYEILQELNRQMGIILVSHDLGIISSHVKTIACISVNGNLFYHDSNKITQKALDSYNCPIDLITHGDLPHRVLGKHEKTGKPDA